MRARVTLRHCYFPRQAEILPPAQKPTMEGGSRAVDAAKDKPQRIADLERRLQLITKRQEEVSREYDALKREYERRRRYLDRLELKIAKAQLALKDGVQYVDL